MRARTGRAAAGLLAAASLALGGSTKVPQVEGWHDVYAKNVCAIGHGPIILATRDGNSFILGVELEPLPKRAAVRDVKIGGLNFQLVFEPSKTAMLTKLDGDALAALVGVGEVWGEWIPGGGHFTGDVRPALTALQHCAVDLARKADRERAAAAALAAFGAGMQRSYAAPYLAMPAPARASTTCFKRGEWSSGMNKNCAYDCLGSEAVQTIGVAELCPLMINR